MPSGELLADQAFLQAVAGVEQKGVGDAALYGDVDAGHVADLDIVGGCRDRSVFVISDFKRDLPPTDVPLWLDVYSSYLDYLRLIASSA